jgi:hypothetical protein
VPSPETFFAIFFLISVAGNFCKTGEITTKLPHEIRSRKSPKINTSSTTYQKIPTKHQKISNKIPKNHQQSPKINYKNQKSQTFRSENSKKQKEKKKPSKNAGKTPPWLHRRGAMTLQTPATGPPWLLSVSLSISLSA